jgi:3-oxoacyl-[acyl-carrier protein] reductase
MAKIAIVTGASRCIGPGIAKRPAADGFAVVVNYAGNGAAARYMTCILQESVYATSVSTREASSNRSLRACGPMPGSDPKRSRKQRR